MDAPTGRLPDDENARFRADLKHRTNPVFKEVLADCAGTNFTQKTSETLFRHDGGSLSVLPRTL